MAEVFQRSATIKFYVVNADIEISTELGFHAKEMKGVEWSIYLNGWPSVDMFGSLVC